LDRLRLRSSHASLTGPSERGGAIEPGMLRLRWAFLGAQVEGGRGARAARAVVKAAWRGEIGPVAVPQQLGRPYSWLRGCGSLNGRPWTAGAAIGAVWRGVAAEPPCVSGRGPHERCLGGVVGGHPGARRLGGAVGGHSGGHQRWGGVLGWLCAVIGRTRHLEDGTGRPPFFTAVVTPIPSPPSFAHPPRP